MQSIKWDVEDLIGKIDIIQKSHIPYAGAQAMKRFAFLFSKQQAPKEMQDAFIAPVPLTLKSVNYKADGLKATFTVLPRIPKGNAPGKYLYPVSNEDTNGRKEIYETRFTNGLRKKGVVGKSYWPVQFLDGRGVKKSNGRMRPSQYQEVLAGLDRKGPGTGGYRYISIPDNRSSLNRANPLPDGIYRVKGRNDVQMLFTYARTKPTVPTIFDLRQYALDYGAEVLPSLLSNALERAMRS